MQVVPVYAALASRALCLLTLRDLLAVLVRLASELCPSRLIHLLGSIGHARPDEYSRILLLVRLNERVVRRYIRIELALEWVRWELQAAQEAIDIHADGL